MAIDPYTPCPGGTGKKVKFCCPDLLGELDDIQRKLEADQRLACLEQIDRLDTKYPDRACLLSMKAMLEAQLADEGKAEATLARFKEKYPGNPVALAEEATLKAARQGGRAATTILQQAIAASGDSMMPQVYDAIAVVAERLLADGQYIAARGHLMLALDLSGHKDERATSLIVNLDGSPQLPLLMKESQPLLPAPEGALWKKSFDAAMEFAGRAMWLDAAQKLHDLARSAGDWPPIWRNIASLRLWLADSQGGIEALRKFARQPLGSSAAPPLDEMVESEALAQLIDVDAPDFVDVLNITYPMTDFDRAIARLSADPRMIRMPMDLARLATEGQPPPKAAIAILDRIPPASGRGITREQIPRVVGQALVFGRETDREARLELVTYRTDERPASERVLTEALEGAIGPAGVEVVTARMPAVRHALSSNWRLPDDTPAEQRATLISAERRTVLLEQWPAMKFKVLEGAAPQDAARDPAMRVPVLAAILILELASMNDAEAFDFNDLRTKIGLPAAQKIDPIGVDVMQIPLARLHRLEASKLSDEQLARVFARATHYRHDAAIKIFGEEVLERPSLEKEIPRQEVYGQLAQIERNPQQAIEYISKARDAAELAGQTSAPWDITEMTLRLSMGDVVAADRLLQHVRSEHIREPGIANLLFQVLVEAGIVHPDGTPALGPSARGGGSGLNMPGVAAAAAPVADSGKIWTPGAEPAATAGKKSVIWTPE